MVVIDMDTVQRKIDKKMEDGLKDLHFARNGSTEWRNPIADTHQNLTSAINTQDTMIPARHERATADF